MSAIQDAYQQIGADYEDVLKRLMNEQLVARFLGKFLEDQSFTSLQQALSAGDAQAAFMAAHTLKGVCQNLGLSNLFAPVNQLTEALRGGSLEGSDALFIPVQAEYGKTVDALKAALQ